MTVSRTIMAVSLVLLMAVPSMAFGTAPRADEWKELARYDDDVRVSPGLPYFVELDPGNRSFTPVAMPMEDAGFSNLMKDAVAAVPDWVRPNLTAKFVQLSNVPITTGGRSSPALGDLDMDGDLDLVVGDTTGVRFYINQGTGNWPVLVSEPAITLNGDFFGDPAKGGYGLWAPAAGDLNNDGAPDLVLGNGQGTLIYYENIKGSDPVSFKDPAQMIIDVGSASHPALGDVDGDGDLDMVVGNDRGALSYYENTATGPTFSWTLRPLKLQGVAVGRNATPALEDLNGDGTPDLTIGSATSGLTCYLNIGGNFVLDPTIYAGLVPQPESAPLLGGLYIDRTTDLYIGLENGRILYYDNIGSYQSAQWKTWSSYDLFSGVSYYPKDEYLRAMTHGTADRYAKMIVNADARYRDEIGFSVANTAPEVLTALNDSQAQLFAYNAQLIYTIDGLVKYADLVERDDHTTIVYHTLVNGQKVDRELPRDVYYWYVVHPQITDEWANYIDPGTGAPADPDHGGRWWREYLFFHADDSYPPDPDPNDPNRRYPTTPPPLLLDLLTGIDVLWNDTRWSAPGGRDPYYGNNALIRVANWVGKTLALNEAESADGERPVQPVRIAHGHNGNCGELQDITVAAARSALIPALGVNMPGEDHVWIEFYEDGWHQWDNYWSDGGAVIDNYMNYWEGWGDRGGAGIFAWRGDDATWEVTQKYIHPDDISKVTFVVKDRNGRPVDGARIVAASYWLLSTNTQPVEVTFPFPSIWNYTGYDGVSTLYLAAQGDWPGANHNFSFKVVSRLGHAEQPKTEFRQGEDYTFTFTLDGAVPQGDLGMTVAPMDEKTAAMRMALVARPGPGLQLPISPADDRTQPVIVGRPSPAPEEAGGTALAFVVDAENLDLYLKGMGFSSLGAVRWGGAVPDAERMVNIPTDRRTFLVVPSEGLVESSRSVSIYARVEVLLRPPTLGINAPMEGLKVPQGDLINVTGTATDPFGITLLELSTDGGRYFRNIGASLANGTWTYGYYTAGEELGAHNIRVRATNGLGVTAMRQVNITIEEVDLARPAVAITAPYEGQDFNEGDSITVRGTASDNKGVTYLALSLNDGGSWMDITTRLADGQWGYQWDTRGRPSDDYIIVARAMDAAGNEASDRVKVTITGTTSDLTRPTVGITRPADGTELTIGATARIEGTASDDTAVTRLTLTTGAGTERDITGRLSSGRWRYDWDTTGLDEGYYTITVTAADGAGNSASSSVQVRLVPETPGGGGGGGGGGGSGPDTTPPKVDIYEPAAGQVAKKGAVVLVYGKATDDSGSVMVDIVVDGKAYNVTDKLQAGYFTFTIDTADMDAGPHTITVKAVDRSGNKDEESVTFTIEKKAEGPQGIPDLVSSLSSTACLVLVVMVFLAGLAIAAKLMAPPKAPVTVVRPAMRTRRKVKR